MAAQWDSRQNAHRMGNITAQGQGSPLRRRAEKAFHGSLGQAAADLVEEGLRRLVEDSNRLEPYFLGLAGGQT
jgi:hypothetical protein